MQPFPSMLAQQWPSSAWNLSTVQMTPSQIGVPPISVAVGGAGDTVASFAKSAGGNGGFINQTQLFGAVLGTVGRRSGKWYFEVALAGMNGAVGFEVAASPQVNSKSSQGFYFGKAGCGVYFGVQTNGSSQVGVGVENDDVGYNFTASGPSPFANAVVGCAVDLENLLIWFSVNGVWSGYKTADGSVVAGAKPATGVGGMPIVKTIYFPGFQAVVQGSSAASFTATLRTNPTALVYETASALAGFSAWDSGPLQQ
jgi:hypothetical protein